MSTRSALWWLACAGLLAIAPAQAQPETRSGDVLSLALPLGVFGAELMRGDQDGARQLALTFALATGTAEGLKRLTRVERPDGTNKLSFPSGHAARAFSAAAYLRQRHGMAVATPGYLTALYVGHTRVHARRHRWADIAGAALVSELAASWLVSGAPDAQRTTFADFDGRALRVGFSTRW